MSFRIKDDFKAKAPVSQIPVSWYNSVAAALNNFLGGTGIEVTFPQLPSATSPVTIDLDLEWLKASGLFVTRDDYQNIIGQKAFSANPVMRDTGRAIEWRDKASDGAVGSTVHAQISSVFPSSGDHAITISQTRGNNTAGVSAIVQSNGSTGILADAEKFSFGPAGETYGILAEAQLAIMNLYPDNETNRGGTVNFRLNGGNSWTSQLHETDEMFRISTYEQILKLQNFDADGGIILDSYNIELAADNGIDLVTGANSDAYLALRDTGTATLLGATQIVLNAPANYAFLAAAPTLTTVDTSSLSIATCGWAYGQFWQKDTANTGLIYNTNGTLSFKTIGTGSGNVAAGDHKHSYADLTTKPDIPAGCSPATTNPANLASDADVGSSDKYARADHVHKLPDITELTATITGHEGNCLLVVQNDGSITHSENKMFDVLSAIRDKFTEYNVNTHTVGDFPFLEWSSSNGDITTEANVLLGTGSDSKVKKLVDLLTSAPSTNKVLTVKANGTALSWEDGGGVPSNPGNQSTTINPSTAAANTGTWEYDGTNGLKLTVQMRTHWSGSTGKLYAYSRVLTFDKKGQLYHVSGETQHEVDAATKVAWS